MMAVRVAQVGCGHWGKNLARNFAELGVLAAVADYDPATADRVGAACGIAPRTFEAILADPTIDGVALATPAPQHAEMALAAITAGKHVYVEKPLALDVADAGRMIVAAGAANRVLMVGHLLRYHPGFIALQQLVADGACGTLQYVYSNRLSLGKYRIEEDVLWSFAPHDLSMILALAGSAPSSVRAQGASFVTPDLADWCLVDLVFPSGLRGHVQASWAHPFKEQRLVVVGDAGSAVFEDSHPDPAKRLALYRHTVDRSGGAPVPNKADAEYVALPAGEPLRDECAHFVACITGDARCRTDGGEGLAVLKVLDAASRALALSLAGDAA
jgi:predicted dehydrogenase